MRGELAPIGSTRVSANGYHYTKTGQPSDWRLTHHIIAEQKLGRPLNGNERVIFGDKGKTCLEPANIKVVPKGKGSLRRRIANIEARISELEAQKAELEEELKHS